MRALLCLEEKRLKEILVHCPQSDAIQTEFLQQHLRVLFASEREGRGETGILE